MVSVTRAAALIAEQAADAADTQRQTDTQCQTDTHGVVVRVHGQDPKRRMRIFVCVDHGTPKRATLFTVGAAEKQALGLQPRGNRGKSRAARDEVD